MPHMSDTELTNLFSVVEYIGCSMDGPEAASLNSQGANKGVCARKNMVPIPHVIVMVGLPARGKTYISKKLSRYLNWIGINTRAFNAGDYRRKATAEKQHDFFRADNIEGQAVRDAVAMAALQDALTWLKNNGDVAIFDATNTTRERRLMVYDKVVKESGFKCLFMESICNSASIIESNVREVKVHSPDYKDMTDKDEAIRDFLERIKHYEDIYEPICEEKEKDFTFLKVFNAGEKLVVNKHEGNVQSRIVYWMMNVHIVPRTIYLTRHGESVFNMSGRLEQLTFFFLTPHGSPVQLFKI